MKTDMDINDNQGRRQGQLEDSAKSIFIGIIGFAIMIILALIQK